MRYQHFITAGILYSILAVAFFVFFPGLSGPFLLDDLLHLPKLSANGSVRSLHTLLMFVFSIDSPTGRPLSLLSFLINDIAWPSDPFSFKYTNLLLHILNGVFIFILSRNLMLIAHRTKTLPPLSPFYRDILSLVITAIWLFHPIHISAMMMVVQRMTLLMSLFIVLGLIAYLKGRTIAADQPVRGYLLMTAGVGLFGLLGAFFKEPAVMICAYIIALELTVLRTVPTPSRYWKTWFSIFILFPLLAIGLYYLYDHDQMKQLLLQRNFDITERLLTETRVLFDYLRIILVPSLGHTGPYHDDFTVSRSLVTPLSTLFGVISITGLLALATITAKRFVLLSFAIFWFFLGHMLESTFLPLELYFEHRNYLPSFGIFFSLVATLAFLPRKVKTIYVGGIALFLLLESSISFSSSSVWGNYGLLSTIWSAEHPRSMRAQVDAINFWVFHDQERALHHLDLAIQHNPESPGLYIHKFLLIRCGKFNELDVPEPDLASVLPNTTFDNMALSDLTFLRDHKKSGECAVTSRELIDIIDIILRNPKFSESRYQRHSFNVVKSKLYRDLGNLNQALISLDQAYSNLPRYDIPLEQAWYLYSAGLYDDALDYIQKARNTKVHKPYVLLWKKQSIDFLEEQIMKRKHAILDGET